MPPQTPLCSDVAGRMSNRVQISTDGLRAYVEAMESAFGADVDYAQIVKTYGHEEVSDNRRYSAPEFVSSEKKVITGNPDEADLYQLHRAAERYHSPAHAPPDSPDAGIQQEARELRGGGCAALRLLQLRKASQYAALHSGNGRWR